MQVKKELNKTDNPILPHLEFNFNGEMDNKQ